VVAAGSYSDTNHRGVSGDCQIGRNLAGGHLSPGRGFDGVGGSTFPHGGLEWKRARGEEGFT
jgi:hypothetical protein